MLPTLHGNLVATVEMLGEHDSRLKGGRLWPVKRDPLGATFAHPPQGSLIIHSAGHSWRSRVADDTSG